MYFFIGIKGSGMAALACMLKSLGHEVEGSDIDKHLFTEEQLHSLHIPIHPLGTLPKEGSHVIVGNAFTEAYADVIAVRNNSSYQVLRYHECLGQLMQGYCSIGITGSHGKTTTTKMMTSILQAHKPTGYLIGDGHGHLSAQDAYLVIEADEYRRFFLSYFPDYALITNVDYDHVDYYKSEADYSLAYEQFSNNVKKALFIFGDDPLVRALKIKTVHYTYGIEDHNDLQARHLIETPYETSFDLYFLGEFKGSLVLPFSGRHLVWNALGSIGIALLENIPLETIQKGISGFVGAARRFVVEEKGANVYIDDYAHHPTEVSVTIDAARLRYPHHRLVAIFKPHRVSRLYHFAQAFADALDKADDVFVCEFNAIDDQEVGYDITIEYLKERSKKARIIQENEAGALVLKALEPAVYLFMSSKDIYVLANHLKRYQNS